MRRETRANLIFLLVVLALALPGAVILFRKKLDPAARPMYLPDPVKHRLPYMYPLETPEQVTRFMPEKTGAWLADLARQASGQSVYELDGHPVFSPDRLQQVLALRKENNELRIWVLRWDDGPQPARALLHRLQSDSTIGGTLKNDREVNLPATVREELIQSGFAKPPATARLLSFDFQGDFTAGGTGTLELDRPAGSDQNSWAIPLRF